MKLLKKSLFLLGILGLSLTSCISEKRCECLETSEGIEYNSSVCYHANYLDVVESFYVSNPPINPDAGEGNYQYDLEWDSIIRLDFFKFVDGLAGKHIITVFKISDTVIKVTFDGNLSNPDATFGYLRISPSAFKGLTERATDAFLYAYISIGPVSGNVAKP